MPVKRMTKTLRGFTIYSEFKDSYGQAVRIQESSAATRKCVWIFCTASDNDCQPKVCLGPHLTVSQAKRVIRALQRFVGSGEGS